ncbi:hypothetical protein P2318_30305 [Myxococcaceae bacterium GXIMD 01537]
MRKLHLGLAVLLMGLSAATITACGDDETEGAGCDADSDCLSNELCHPQANVCVKTCSSSNDCTSEAKNCEALSAADSRQICKCTTDELCQGGNIGSSALCSDAFRICVTRCSDDTGCPTGQTCDTTSGECRGGGGTEPVCSPACTGNQVCDDRNGATSPQCVDRCTFDGCLSTENCNLTTGRCEIAAECNPANAQPDTCAYGQFCTATELCDFVPKATCVNFTSGGRSPTFNPATSTGPIIFFTQKDTFANDAFCGGGTHVAIRVQAYRTSGTFSSTEATFVQELRYVRTDGSEGNISTAITGLSVSPDGKSATFTVNFCPGNINQFTAGLLFVNGNETCATVSR